MKNINSNLKLNIDIEIYKAKGNITVHRKLFDDYKLDYKPKNIPDLIRYLESKKYKIICFDTTRIRDKNKIYICIERTIKNKAYKEYEDE